MLAHPAVDLAYRRVLFLICPTGRFCREDRCQSYFKFSLIPTMRTPLEECEAAGAVRDAGGEAFLIDAPAEDLSDERFIQAVTKISADAIIVGVTYGSLDDDLKWCRTLKDLAPHTPIGLRGAPCYTFGRSLFKKCAEVDFYIRGDYEVVLNSLITTGLISAPGITVRSPPDEPDYEAPPPLVENLDHLSLPDRSIAKSSLYTVRGLRKPQATIRVQRGCPYPCSYCLVHTVSGSRARHRSPDSIAREMRALMESGITHFYLRAETFSLDRRWALDVCEALSSLCRGSRWVTTTRVERVDDDLLAAMKRAGCYGISFGADVVSKTIGERVSKFTDRARTSGALDGCRKHGIISLLYLMIGFVWETEDTLKEVRDFALSVTPDLLTIHFAHPYPGTRYYNDVMSEGIKIISPRAQAEPALERREISPQKLQQVAREILMRHYIRPSVLVSVTSKVAKLALRRP